MVTKIKPEELAKSIGSSVEDKRNIKQQRESIEYLQKHYWELLEKYQNKWVVIKSNQLIAAEDTSEKLIKYLDESGEKNTFLYYLANPEDMLIL